jgi:hypothetical protein
MMLSFGGPSAIVAWPIMDTDHIYMRGFGLVSLSVRGQCVDNWPACPAKVSYSKTCNFLVGLRAHICQYVHQSS